jgi:hypothetical protein
VNLPANDPVNHPKHYTSDPSGIECIQITRHRNFNIGNAIKYLWRAGLKDNNVTKEEYEKAIWYIQDEIKRLFPDTSDKPKFDLNTNPNMHTCFYCQNYKESTGDWWISHNGCYYHSECFKDFVKDFAPGQWTKYTGQWAKYTGQEQ